MWRRRSWFSLKGKAGIPGQERSRPATSARPRAPPAGSVQQRVSGETVRLPKSQDAVVCWFYMGAVQDFTATVEEEGGPSLIGSCVPDETTRMELVRAFTKYA